MKIALLLAALLASAVLPAASPPAELVSEMQQSAATALGHSFAPTFSADGDSIAFVSQAANLTSDGSPSRFLNVYVRKFNPSRTVLVSANAAGTGGGNEDSNFPSISGNGEKVVFLSWATDLIPGVSNRFGTVVVRDLSLGSNFVVNVTTNGTPASGADGRPIISPDGRRVAFYSRASSLVTNTLTQSGGLYVRDLIGGATVLASPSFGSGDAARGPSAATVLEPASFSDDGRFLCFFSTATNLVEGATNWTGIYIRDLEQNQMVWASAFTSPFFTNWPALSWVQYPVMSADGNAVVYLAASSPTTPPVLFHYNRPAGATTVLATNVASLPASLSANGRFVTYTTPEAVWLADLQTLNREIICDASSLPGVIAWQNPAISLNGNSVAFLTGPTVDGPWSVFSYDRLTATRMLVSISTNGAPALATVRSEPVPSPTGESVAFESSGSEIAPGDLNGSNDIFLRDLASTSIAILSSPAIASRTALPTLGSSIRPGSVSDHARFITFTSTPNHLAVDHANPWQDVLVHDRLGHTNQLVLAPGPVASARLAFAPALSTDGLFVAWFEQPVPQTADTAITTNIFWMNRETGMTRIIGFGGTLYAGLSPALSPDGHWLAFAERTFAGGVTNVFVREMTDASASNILISVSRNGSGGGNNHSSAPKFSPDGRWLLFVSSATDLQPDVGTIVRPNLFAADLHQGKIRWASSPPGLPFLLRLADGRSAISGNSRFVVFEGFSSPSRAVTDLYRHDLLTTNATLPICSGCSNPSVSDDGRMVAYEIRNGAQSLIVVQDILTRSTTLISSNENTSVAGLGDSTGPLMSGDGRYVVYASRLPNLVPDDTNGVTDVFVYDRLLRSNFLVSRAPDGTPGKGTSTSPVLAPDGRMVVFTSTANNLVPVDFNNGRDVFALRLGGPDTDFDGLDDQWEFAHFGSLDHDGTADSDGDGAKDGEEYRAATDPTNGLSVLKILSSSYALDDTRVIIWNAEFGRRYRIHFKRTLNDAAWTDLDVIITASGNTASYADASAPAETTRFYQVTPEPIGD